MYSANGHMSIDEKQHSEQTKTKKELDSRWKNLAESFRALSPSLHTNSKILRERMEEWKKQLQQLLNAV